MFAIRGRRMRTASLKSDYSVIMAEIEQDASVTLKRQHSLNLPQMALGGISENWMLKELGDMHWTMICKGLDTRIENIVDRNKNRLYASFVRIRYESDVPLAYYKESETLHLSGRIKRYGSKMFFSDVTLDCTGIRNNASLMTIFVSRQGGNKKISVTSPLNEAKNRIEPSPILPDMGRQYLKLKPKLFDTSAPADQTNVCLAGELFNLEGYNLYQTEYHINPYYDLNGVNLLYFASYTQINDFCERQFFHNMRDQFGITKDWSLSVSPLARDIYYFGNCDIEDTIVYRLDACDFIDDFKLKTSSSLYRKKDRQLIARIFTVKKLISE